VPPEGGPAQIAAWRSTVASDALARRTAGQSDLRRPAADLLSYYRVAITPDCALVTARSFRRASSLAVPCAIRAGPSAIR
jgi:hypothetical protein